MNKLALSVVLFLPAPGPDTVTITGTVKLDEPRPQPRVDRRILDAPDCARLHGDPPMREDLVVGADQGVRWAFVWVSQGLEASSFAAPPEPVLVDQAGCRFVPHVAGVRVGQTVNFRNGDPMLHNIQGLTFANRGFNVGQPPGGVTPLQFPNPEVMVKVVCNVHPWMSVYLGVLPHPYFAVTDASGKFEIKGLPKGSYRLSVWHESLKAKAPEIAADGSGEVSFTLTR